MTSPRLTSVTSLDLSPRLHPADISPSRLEFARGQGADGTVHIDGASEEELASRVVAALGGPPTAILECCGAASSVRMAIQVRPGTPSVDGYSGQTRGPSL